MTDRRGFLGGLAALSAAAVPIVAQAATLSEWDKLSAALAIINPQAPRAVAHAKNAGMRPEWLWCALLDVPDKEENSKNCWPALMFNDAEGVSRTFRPKGETGKSH